MNIIKLKNTVVYSFQTLNSTQKHLIQNQSNYNFFEIIHTENQTRGIGRKNTSWISFEGSLTFSFKINKRLHIINYICYVLKTYYRVNCYSKWPNDIYLDDHKICGVLIDETVVGIGINLLGSYKNYQSIESLSNKRIDWLDFIDNLVFIIKNIDVRESYYNMPNYLFFNNKYVKVLMVEMNKLIVECGEKIRYEICCEEYSYDQKNNTIIKK